MRCRVFGRLLPVVFAAVAAAAPAHASVMAGSHPNPDDVDLALWLKADALALAEGAAVERWPDARANGRGAVANGAAPSYAADALAGLPGVRFDGAQRSLRVDEPVHLSREHTIVVVGHARSEVEGRTDTFVAVCDRSGCDTARPPRVALRVRKQRAGRVLEVRYPRVDGAAEASSAASAALDAPAVIAQMRGSEKYVRAYAGAVTPPLIRINTATRPLALNAGALWIGGSGDPSTSLTGDVFEVLVYDRALSVRELRDLFAYLTNKWLPGVSAEPRVVLQFDRTDSRAAVTFGGQLAKSLAPDHRSTIIAPDGAAHSPDVWHRDRGRSGFDILDGSIDFFVRFELASKLWTARPLLELDGGARGLMFAVRRTGPRAFEARLAVKDPANAAIATLVATAAPIELEANALYHVAVTLATRAADGGITLKLFAAPANTPIAVSQSTFEIASATGPPIDGSVGSHNARLGSDIDHAFNAAAGVRVDPGVARLRIWRGVPQIFDAVATFPDLASQATPHPEPEPAYPSGFDSFTPPVAAARPAPGAPVLAEWTRSGAAGDSLAITGDQLSAFDGDDAGKDTKFAVFGQSTESRNLAFASVRQLEGHRGVIGLAEALPPGSMYLIWPGNARGFGRPVPVNQTEAWWIGPDRATRGDTVHAYGRNLSHDGGTSSAFLYLEPRARKPGRWITPVDVNPYRVGFRIPEDVSNGSYALWAHNGHGGRYGWSKPIALTIDDGSDWSGATIDVAANGTDEVADDVAIQTALREAESAAKADGRGATVRFPAGRFYVTQTILPPSNVRLIGAGKGKTVIAGMRDFAASASLLMFERTHAIELADLTLDFGRAVPKTDPGFVMTGVVENLRLNGVRLIAVNEKQFLTYLVATRTSFADCDFIGPQVLLLESRQVSFERSNFYVTGNAITLYAARGARELSVDRCTARDYNAGDDTTGAGWSQGRFVNIVNNANVSRDIYIGENTTFDLGVHPKYAEQNTGEQISWDEAVAQAPSAVIRATNDPRADAGGVQLAAAPPPVAAGRSYIATITRGKGEGQVRDVTSVSGRSIRVSPAWNVIPDATSTLALGSFHERAVVYRNHLDGKAAQSLQSVHTASAGIEPYGGASNVISDGNTITDCRHGFFTMGTSSLPTLFNLYTNNLIVGSRYPNTLTAGGSAASEIASYGQVFRSNTVGNSVEDTARFFATTKSGNLDMLVFDRNVSTDTAAGYVVHKQPATSEVGSVVFVDDYLDQGSAALAGPRQALELPTRQLAVSARLGGEPVQFSLPILNSGSTAVTYRLARTPSAVWLSMPQTPIELSPRAELAVPLACDPRGLGPGKYDATLYVVSGESKRAASIQCSVLR